MKAIHKIPETNGYAGQDLVRALTSRFLKKYKFLIDLNSADHENALTFFRPSSNRSKIDEICLRKKCN